MKNIKTLLAALVVLVGLAVPAWAQTALSATTLSAAITGVGDTTMTVAATTGFVANTTLAIIDREIVSVRAVNTTSLVVTISRGQNSTRATTHASGATVTVGPPAAFVGFIPSGSCTRANLPYVPLIVGGTTGLGNEVGSMWDCMGVGAAGQWVNTNSTGGPPILGSTVASPAGVMTGTGNYFKVSGTNAVTGITVPAGAAAGFCLSIEPLAAFTTTTATNIVIASTAVIGKQLNFCWDGTTKWVPSY